MDKEKYIINNYFEKDILKMTEFLKIDFYDYCDIVFKNKLYLKNTSNIARKWEEKEDDIIKKYSHDLNIRYISNMLWRSYYATYKRVRYLGIDNLIQKRGKKK